MRRIKASSLKLEKHERQWRNRVWREFSMTHKGRMSWANWFRTYCTRRMIRG